MVLQFNACRRNTVAAGDVIVSPGLRVLSGSSPILIRPGGPVPDSSCKKHAGSREKRNHPSAASQAQLPPTAGLGTIRSRADAL
jgi:hypothetical protein